MTDGRFVEVIGDQPRSISDEYDPTVEVSVVIPTYDEADNIADLLRRLSSALTTSGMGFELIVVDDDSPDSTWLVAADLTDEIPELVVLRRKEASGLATAVIGGCEDRPHHYGEINITRVISENLLPNNGSLRKLYFATMDALDGGRGTHFPTLGRKT